MRQISLSPRYGRMLRVVFYLLLELTDKAAFIRVINRRLVPVDQDLSALFLTKIFVQTNLFLRVGCDRLYQATQMADRSLAELRG